MKGLFSTDISPFHLYIDISCIYYHVEDKRPSFLCTLSWVSLLCSAPSVKQLIKHFLLSRHPSGVQKPHIKGRFKENPESKKAKGAKMFCILRWKKEVTWLPVRAVSLREMGMSDKEGMLFLSVKYLLFYLHRHIMSAVKMSFSVCGFVLMILNYETTWGPTRRWLNLS